MFCNSHLLLKLSVKLENGRLIGKGVGKIFIQHLYQVLMLLFQLNLQIFYNKEF